MSATAKTVKRAVAYLSETEKEVLKIAAYEAMTSESEYIRRAVLDKIRSASAKGQQYLRDHDLDDNPDPDDA